MTKLEALPLYSLLTAILLISAAFGKDLSSQTILWPESGSPILRFTFGKFKEIGSIGNERTYSIDTTAESLWSKTISNANFSLYLFDKNKVRIANGRITLTNVGPGETVKFQTTVASSGTPVSLSLAADY